MLIVVALAAIGVSFTLSASAGLGGSLVLVPALSLVLGVKEGVALAALLLAGNNVMKLFAYRATLPVRPSLWVILATIVGSAVGARILVLAPERVIVAAVLASFLLTFAAERMDLRRLRTAATPMLALASGATSGVSGTSGPLKGVALRNLGLDRLHLVGAASLVSLAGDATKSAIYAEASLLDAGAVGLALASAPLMVGATLLGRRINSRIGERGYTLLFWGVMGGYSARLLFA